jgi:hypothetical protein
MPDHNHSGHNQVFSKQGAINSMLDAAITRYPEQDSAAIPNLVLGAIYYSGQG